ncbi:MAG: hypothetical protein KC503_17335 [Myxococcales bacterium]|nr:hypothetical protein [Myxococcales bacterium]
MTALSADRKTVFNAGDVSSYGAAQDIIYLGALVGLNSSGYADPVPANWVEFLGVSQETVDNSGGSAGDLDVQVRKTGVRQFASSGLAITDIGKALFASDDQTVTLTPSGPPIGILDSFESATVAPVRIQPGIKVGAPFTLVVSRATAVPTTTAAQNALQDYEHPTRFMVLSGFANATVAPGSGVNLDITLTNGTTSNDSVVQIAGTATKGENKTINKIYAAATDLDVTMAHDATGGAAEDIVCVFNCIALG